MKENRTYIFEKMPVKKAVITMAVPTIVSQIISMVYNMADTFFVGRLGDANLVAAVSIAAPASLLLTALANLFGIGGAAVFSRALGANEPEKAKRASAFGFYSAVIVSLIVSLCFVVFSDALLRLMGADDFTLPYVKEYIKWVIVFGAAPQLLSLVFSHLVRADGAAKLSGTILSMGGLVNLLLDPFFMFAFGLGLKGAAIATLLSNCFTFVLFAAYYFRQRSTTAVSVRPVYFDFYTGKDVMMTGLPSMLQTLLSAVSNTTFNNTAAKLGDVAALASLGIVKKLDQIPMSVSIGFAQGVLPMLGYNSSSGNKKRLKESFRFTVFLALTFSVICVLLYECFPGGLIRVFLNDDTVVTVGTKILRIMCLSTPLMAFTFNTITAFQAMGKNKAGSILSILRKGVIDIPLLLILGFTHAPVLGIAFVQPVTEVIAMVSAIVLLKKTGVEIDKKV